MKLKMKKDSSAQSLKTSGVVIAWVLVAAWAALIFAMSANSGSNLTEELGFFSQVYQQLKVFVEGTLGFDADIINSMAHFLEYGAFGVLLVNALCHHMSLRKACFAALVCASVYGITDELHQYFVPERMCDSVDWLVDTVGASIGVGLSCLVLRRKNKKL